MSDGDHGRIDAHSQPEPASDFPMSDIEMELTDLRTTAGILGHIAASSEVAVDSELYHIQNQIIIHHDRLQAFWQQAWEEQQRERKEHEAALAAAKARTAPGSQAEAERVDAWWRALKLTARAALDAVNEAMPEGMRALAGDAGLPPAESEGRAPA